jgi:hypothetical protein
LKFTARILQLLQDAERRRKAIEEIGLAWCPDGRTFICNARTAAISLSIAANSVNTNFREHGFRILPCPVEEIRRHFPEITDTANWKKRTCTVAVFCKHTSLQEANEMTIVKTLKPSVEPESSIPESVPTSSSAIDQLFSSDSFEKSSLLHHMHKTEKPPEWQSRFLEVIARDWIDSFGAVRSVDMDHFLDVVLTPVCSNDNYQILRINSQFLVLSRNDALSQRSETVDFDDYLLLMLRYGRSTRFPDIMLDLAAEDSDSDLPDPGFDHFTSFLYLSEDRRPYFKDWFRPRMRSDSAQSLLAAAPAGAWIVRQSSRLTKFTFDTRSPGGKFMSSYIEYDALEQKDRAYSIVMEGEEVRHASSLPDLLFNVLKFSPQDCVVAPRQELEQPTQLVEGRQLIAVTRDALLDRLEPGSSDLLE